MKSSSDQFDLFDIGRERFLIDKPIRLIELFAGYGSQALALKYLGVPFEHWLISEWAIPSIKAYALMHDGEDGIGRGDYAADLTDDEIREYFKGGRISANYNEPLTDERIAKMPIDTLRGLYNDMRRTHNAGSVSLIHGSELGIIDTDEYCYVLTYSFPCQDLSRAGQGKGAEKGSGTRSALLWEIERLLRETPEKPQVLIMENVSALLEKDNVKVFSDWLSTLDSFGYHSKYTVLDASDYMIPQHRERVFCVSVLDGTFDFPRKTDGCPPLSALLETDVDESLFLREDQAEIVLNSHYPDEHDARRTFDHDKDGLCDDEREGTLRETQARNGDGRYSAGGNLSTQQETE